MQQTMAPPVLADLGRLLHVAPAFLVRPSSEAGSAFPWHKVLVRALLVDGCSTFRSGLRHALLASSSVAAVSECDTSARAMALCAENDVDVAVVDIDLPDQSGLELCRLLSTTYRDVRIIMLSQANWDVYIAAARAAGAHGFLLRRMPTEELVSAVRSAAMGPLFSAEQLERVGNWVLGVGELLISLSPREWDVLWLVSAGMSNRDIAAQLVLSENTVEKHIGSILRKLCVRSRAELLAFILQHHLEVLNPPGQWPASFSQGWWLKPAQTDPARSRAEDRQRRDSTRRKL